MVRLGFWTLMVVGSVSAVACESSDGGENGASAAAAGVPDAAAGQPGSTGGANGSGGTTGGTGSEPVAGEAPGATAGVPGSSEGGAGGMASAGGAPGGAGDGLEGCMTPTPGLVDYCADEPEKKNAIYCVAPSELPFADCSVAPGHPPNFDGWCCETAVCVRSTSWDTICGVLAPGKTAGYTCHPDAEAPSADCMRTDDGACCPL